ncbi:AraC family transcriptional regulator [Pasteurellaceae bacterium RH1A]|nr:AraC family transcriptional regulator [Pasteurellaceae bacterium RH1A]
MQKIVLYAYPQFNHIVFSIPHSLFKAELDGFPLFELKIASETGENQVSDLGTIVPVDGDLSLFDWAEMIVIAGWAGGMPSSDFMEKLQTAYQRGAKLVGLCYGAYGLAYAGLLDGKQTATHWLAEQDFAARFPKARLDTNSLYITDGQITTSAGAMAGLDCCLHLIREIKGANVANRLARILVSAPHRTGGQAQFIQMQVPKNTPDERINRLLDYLQTHLDQAHSLADLADRSQMSRRTFSRHFHKATGMNLVEWLTVARLNRSQELLENSGLTIEQIAYQVGFGTVTHFRERFKARFKVSPSEWRGSFGGKEMV